ncbi:MAG: monovalent cation/H+ antiporter subunit A [Burkholderiaceae bacterium]|jgi:multicomponent K+:H+ antiporter subunit A|nr:monovalent cation/H+ antiporter subunit A [Burkholderiaceae bacterium]
MDLALLLVLPFAGSAVAALLPARARNAAATWAIAVSAVALAGVIALYPQLAGGVVLRRELAWLPGAPFMLRADGLAWLFALLVTGIGALVALYARYYLSPGDPAPRFFSFFLAFMGAMLGVVLAGNLIELAFFWELTSLFSFLLIGYWHHRSDARRGALMALTMTGAGGLALLAGVLLLGHIVGSYDLDAVLAAGARIRAHPLYRPMLTLVLLGALTKSAQFPFHIWLPRAMAAPTPVSAYLHSATMVKAGVFLLARLWPALAGTPEWFWIVSTAGLITLLLGALLAMLQTDLKGLLAYSTLSHLGLITLLLGLNRNLAAVAAVFHIMNHATFKASLFMAAGIVDHETGTRDMRRLRGLRRAMPVTALLAGVSSCAMAGVPLFNGFLSKEMFFAETVEWTQSPWLGWGLPIAATLAGAFAVAYSLRVAADVFFGPPPDDLPRQPHEPPRWMRVPVELLALLCLVVGIAPQWSVGAPLALAARPVVGGALPAYSLAIWHGINKPLVMSVIALALGAGLHHVLRQPRVMAQARALAARLPDGQWLLRRALLALERMARRALRLIATDRLQTQLLWLLLIAIAFGWASLTRPFAPVGLAWGDRLRVPGSVEFALVWVMGCGCALAAAWQAKFHRLAALILASSAGLAVALTFVWFSAPDLALTQLAVETATTVLFLLGLRWLPRRKRELADRPAPGGRIRQRIRQRARRVRDLLVACAAGGGMAALAYAMMTRNAPQSISPYFLEHALPQGGGANVVNVMLVDFRGFDTLGEITVLGIVALTVYALLRRFRPPQESAPPPRQQWDTVFALTATDLEQPRAGADGAQGYLKVPAALARLIVPIAALIAAHLFLRGHNAPGGGFVAGLVVALAFVSQYMMAGTQWVEERMNLAVLRWIGAGLLIALATGLGSLIWGYPFLTSHSAHLALPWVGQVHLPSAAFFDAGVFATVVGSVLLILVALAHQSLRGQRVEAKEEGA